MIDITATLTLVVMVCSAVLGVSAVLGLLYTITAKPKLDRIENHLIMLNGSVGRAADWQHQHELDHAWSERE